MSNLLDKLATFIFGSFITMTVLGMIYCIYLTPVLGLVLSYVFLVYWSVYRSAGRGK